MTFAGASQLGVAAEVRGKAAELPGGIAYTGLSVPAAGGGASEVVYLVFRPTTAYFSVASAAASLVPAGKTIVSVSLSGSQPSAEAKAAADLEGFNLQLLLDELAWGVVAATSTGHQVLDQVPLERYTVSVSLRRALAGASGPGAAAMRRSLRGELAASGAAKGRVRMTVWVDGPGRIARIETPLPGLGLGRVRAILSQYGAKLTAGAQPDAQVVPLSALHVPIGKARQSPLRTFGLAR